MNDPVRLTIRLDRPTAEAVRREARRRGTSVSAVVSEAVRKTATGSAEPSGTQSPVTDALAGVAAGATFGRDEQRAYLALKHR